MKTTLLLFFIYWSAPIFGQCSFSELSDKEDSLGYAEFMHYMDSLNCKDGDALYFRVEILFINDRIQEYKTVVTSIISNEDAIDSLPLFRSQIVSFCMLMMEENRNLKNKEGFNFWKNEAYKLRSYGCATGRTKQTRRIYFIFRERYALLSDSKMTRKYNRKLHRNYAITKRFFRY